MFHKIRSITPLSDYKINVEFCEGVTKVYDVKPLFNKYKVFNTINNENFYDVKVDVGGFGIIWDDDVDLSCDELWENGKKIVTPFDNLMAFSDATTLWGLNESTLRKAVHYGKFVRGIDVCKFGKQWVVSMDAMKREYGEPKM